MYNGMYPPLLARIVAVYSVVSQIRGEEGGIRNTLLKGTCTISENQIAFLLAYIQELCNIDVQVTYIERLETNF